MSTTDTQLDSKVIDDLVHRIVDAIHPLKIFLFGSAARGRMGPDSDIDVMVVLPDGTHCLKAVQYLYKQLSGFGFPVDILTTTPARLERHKHNIGLIYRRVLAEGREVYNDDQDLSSCRNAAMASSLDL